MPLNSVDRGDAVDFLDELLELDVDPATANVVHVVRGRLARELLHPDQDPLNAARATLRNLHERVGLLGVPDRLPHRAQVGLQLVGDREAGGVVRGRLIRKPDESRPIDRVAIADELARFRSVFIAAGLVLILTCSPP